MNSRCPIWPVGQPSLVPEWPSESAYNLGGLKEKENGTPKLYFKYIDIELDGYMVKYIHIYIYTFKHR